MSGFLVLTLGMVGAIGIAVLSNMVNDEVRGWLDRIPFGLLKLARRRLPEDLRVSLYDEEWLPELEHIIHFDAARPISRLLIGTSFSLGLLRTARRIGRERAKLAGPGLALKRLISQSTVVNALGNITTVVIGYGSILIVSAAGGVALLDGVAIGRSNLLFLMKVVLFLILGPATGVLVGYVVAFCVMAAFDHLVYPPPIKWSSEMPPPALDWSARTLEQFASFIADPENDNEVPPRVVAIIIWTIGTFFGMFFGLSISRIMFPLLVATVTLAGIGVIRVLAVALLQKHYQRRHARIVKSAEDFHGIYG